MIFENLDLLKIIASYLDPKSKYMLSRVNKLCQQEFAPRINQIDSDNDSHYIQTDYFMISISVDNETQCCETGPSATVSGNIKKFKKSMIVGIVLDPPEETLPQEIEEKLSAKKSYSEYLSMYVLKIFYKKSVDDKLRKIYFAVGNSHNGYYAHYADIIFNGEIINHTYL